MMLMSADSVLNPESFITTGDEPASCPERFATGTMMKVVANGEGVWLRGSSRRVGRFGDFYSESKSVRSPKSPCLRVVPQPEDRLRHQRRLRRGEVGAA